jgi:hypothetical protein
MRRLFVPSQTEKERTMKKLFQTLATFSLRPFFANRSGSRATVAGRASRRFRPRLETLEDRALLTGYTAATAADLIADINAANKSGGASIITLTASDNSPYVLSAVDNNTNGANGLPVIGKNKAVDLTIVNVPTFNSPTIERNQAVGTPAFRLFDVAAGSFLELDYVSLQNGLAQGSGAAADGGAIYNQGTLRLKGAWLQDNAAVGTNGAPGLVTQVVPKKFQVSSLNGQPGGDAAGGAIWSSGSVDMEPGELFQNQAVGGQGGAGGSCAFAIGNGGAGGNAYGGGLYEAGGSVVTNAVFEENAASGGAGGNMVQGPPNLVGSGVSGGAGGIGAGGGLYAALGTLNVSSVVQANQASGGNGGERYDGPVTVSGNGGDAYGGGIVLAGGTATLAKTGILSNVATGGTGGYGIERSGGNGGNAFGGGLYVGGGALALTNDSISGNEALAGLEGGSSFPGVPVDGIASGGGIEIAAAATVSLDSSTLNNTANNYIGGADTAYFPLESSDIDGTYILLN